MKKITLVILIISTLFSCGSKRKIVTKKDRSKETVKVTTTETEKESESEPVETKEPKSFPSSTEHYISQYKDIAIDEMKRYNIPASITLAQGILESGSGKGRLAVKANNHFGIKCHGWEGKKIYHDDDKRQECFRKYDNAKFSFRDHSEFLVNRKRYSNLFKLKLTDYKGWAKELRRAGYATDKKYPDKLISLIDRYELHKYDLIDEEVVAVNEDTKVFKHVVVKGDTLYSISKRYNLTVDDLKKLNKLNDTNLRIGQVLVLSKNK